MSDPQTLPLAASVPVTDGMRLSGLIERSNTHLVLRLPYPLSVNDYRVPVAVLNKKTCRYVGALTLSPEARAYHKDIATLSLFWKIAVTTKPVEMVSVLYRPANRGDASNYLKLLEDSLEGIVYKNDSQIQDARIIKKIDRLNPRVVVTIRILEP